MAEKGVARDGNWSPGRFDGGAEAGGVREADVALAWGLTLKYILTSHGFEVFMTSDDNTDTMPVGQRDNRAAAVGCDLLTGKPTNVMRNVLRIFVGSGTTLVAAVHLKTRFQVEAGLGYVGTEWDPGYDWIACEQVEKAENEAAERTGKAA